MTFILGNRERQEYLVVDNESVIPYLSNNLIDAKTFDKRIDALHFIEKYEKLGFHADYIHIINLHKVTK